MKRNTWDYSAPRKSKTKQFVITDDFNYRFLWDTDNNKAITAEFTCWLTPTYEFDYHLKIRALNKAIRQYLHSNLNKSKFNTPVVVTDVPKMNFDPGKKSFMQMEIVFYLKRNRVITKQSGILIEMNDVISNVYNLLIKDNEYFDINTKKNSKRFKI